MLERLPVGRPRKEEADDLIFHYAHMGFRSWKIMHILKDEHNIIVSRNLVQRRLYDLLEEQEGNENDCN